MNLCEGLGFKYLSFQEQQAYKIILKAFSAMAASFKCPQINQNEDLMKIIQTVLGDNPSVTYFDKTKIQIEESFLDKRIILTGVYSKHQAEKMNQSLEATVNMIASSLNTGANNEYSLLINLSEFLQKNIRYDKEENQVNSKGISINPSSHNAYGALLMKRAVCDGFSSAFALLAKKLGFECMLVVGRSAYISTTLVNHAWNIVKVKNGFYHMDVTWDAKKYSEVGDYSYSYFALDDNEIKNDHEWDKTVLPICHSNDLSYYIRNGLYANNIAHLNDIIRKSNYNPIRLKLSPSINLPGNPEQYLFQIYANTIAQTGKHTQITYSWNEKQRSFFAKPIK